MKRLASLLLAVLALVAIGVAQGALSINGAGATSIVEPYGPLAGELDLQSSDEYSD